MFPTTADELSSSQPTRQNPLSPDELNTIRSIIGSAQNSSNKAAHGSNTSAITKLTGRRVLVPVTSKGLFEGILEPPIDSGSERLVIHVGEGKFTEMNREEAREYFDKKVNEISPSNGAKLKPEAPRQNEPTDVNNTKPNESAFKSVTKTKPATSPVSNEDDTPTLPFMEIREECDDTGNIVHSEIINISNQIERLDDGLKQSKDGDGKQLGEILAKVLKDGESDIQTNYVAADPSEVSNASTSIDQTQTESLSKKSKKLISDADYEALTSRLEELERLEAADAVNKSNNVKSSKRLQSKGWGKGFLNAKSKSSSAQKQSTKLATKHVKQVHTEEIAEAAPTTDRKVSFSKELHVKEISPRAAPGELQNKPQRAAPIIYNNSTVKEVQSIDSFPPVATVPFEENVFRGVVKERSTSNSSPEQYNHKPDEQGGKKKLSRFAMQRLERGV